jgi:hypothetical protein
MKRAVLILAVGALGWTGCGASGVPEVAVPPPSTPCLNPHVPASVAWARERLRAHNPGLVAQEEQNTRELCLQESR